VPSDSKVFHPRIVEGRALVPEDGRAILLNSKIAADEGIGVGEKVELTISDRTSEWTVVGLILNVNNGQRDNFVLFEALAREMGHVNRGALVMVQSEDEGAAALEALMDDLRTAYEARGLEVAVLQSVAQVRQMNKAQFSIITYLMLAMSLLAAIVGCVGLMSTMSINVLERGREIGVMRAIGARSVSVLGLFVVEGMLVGALSWLFATPLSYPSAQAFNALVSNTLFQIPLDFDYSFAGVILWLVIVMVLSALASLWPALRATQISVRESLAYE
jgi:putative ABC transport system permease protein